MWESRNGRPAMPPWSDPPATTWTVGERIANNYQPPSLGAVVAVDAEHGTISINWDGESGAIVYPVDATYLRKAWPWEN
jgi:hypothetical protein